METKQKQYPVVDVTGDRSKVRCCKEQYCVLLLLSCFSCVQLCATHRWQPTMLCQPWDSPGKNTGMGCHFLLQCNCIGTWNVRSMNQGKLEVVKQEMARVKVDILGISELK